MSAEPMPQISQIAFVLSMTIGPCLIALILLICLMLRGSGYLPSCFDDAPTAPLGTDPLMDVYATEPLHENTVSS